MPARRQTIQTLAGLRRRAEELLEQKEQIT
jgi:hypothetical protein